MRYFKPIEPIEGEFPVYEVPDNFKGFTVIGNFLENGMYLHDPDEDKRVVGQLKSNVWLDKNLYAEIDKPTEGN